MLRFVKKTLAALVLAGGVQAASAFSLMGPFEAWQVFAIGYRVGGDIGGPQNLGEEYRWNIRTITYGFDESFLNYFGTEGVTAVNRAIAILNALPPVSQMSSNLAEFPLDTRRVNFQASALSLLDVKSATLSIMLEELGLADPQRYTWTLRSRTPFPAQDFTNYLVIRRNFDPVTFSPSSFVNGVLYTYRIFEQQAPLFSDAEEDTLDPNAFPGSAVASGSFSSGSFYIGLTRDDVGGMRYLYRPNNYNRETLVPGTTGGFGSPWEPIGSTNTNAVANIALRPGIDKLSFQPAAFDSQLGNFRAVTNFYTNIMISNSTEVTQSTRRVMTNSPDILFSAEDLGVSVGGSPFVYRRTAAAAPNWQNNNLINGQATLNGPGQIQSSGTAVGIITPVVITFNKVGPFIINQSPSFLDEFNGFPGFVWGSFDGTTNPPIVFPIGTSIQDLETQVLWGP